MRSGEECSRQRRQFLQKPKHEQLLFVPFISCFLIVESVISLCSVGVEAFFPSRNFL